MLIQPFKMYGYPVPRVSLAVNCQYVRDKCLKRVSVMLFTVVLQTAWTGQGSTFEYLTKFYSYYSGSQYVRSTLGLS